MRIYLNKTYFYFMSNNSNLRWVTKTFTELNVNELYALLRLRSEVFVLEQHCIFLDMDNNDQKAYHTIGFIGDEVVATTRLFDKNIMYFINVIVFNDQYFSFFKYKALKF